MAFSHVSRNSPVINGTNWIINLSSVPGQQGSQGDTGAQGLQGAQGNTGAQGLQGAQGSGSTMNIGDASILQQSPVMILPIPAGIGSASVTAMAFDKYIDSSILAVANGITQALPYPAYSLGLATGLEVSDDDWYEIILTLNVKAPNGGSGWAASAQIGAIDSATSVTQILEFDIEPYPSGVFHQEPRTMRVYAQLKNTDTVFVRITNGVGSPAWEVVDSNLSVAKSSVLFANVP